MKKVLIFSGTTEGRQLSGILARSGVMCHVCVATEYGKQVMEDNPNQVIFTGRLNADDMRKMYEENEYEAVIDATHPFADIVTANIKKSLTGKNIRYFRLIRDTTDESGQQTICLDTKDAISKLKNTKGNILLTTGSKSLALYCEDEQLRQRLYVRVLPGTDNIAKCESCGIKGGRIIAMQGPFSVQMNEAIIRQFDIENIVTKESGSNGGFHEKIEAAKNTGIACFVIRNPESLHVENTDYAGIKDICDALGVQYNPMIDVTLAGIGMGSDKLMTVQVAAAVKNADYVFGAPRMLEIVQTDKTYPYYLSRDIIPALQEIYKREQRDIKAVVLFSGDSGFFSGSAKLKESLCGLPYVNTRVMPGISSISALAAKTGISWQDACIKTTHGIERSDWLSQVLDSVLHNRKTFIITSGSKDMLFLLEELVKLKCNPVLYIGTNLSYEDESIETVSVRGYEKSQSQQGVTYKFADSKELVSAFIINENPADKKVTPAIRDGEFIRQEDKKGRLIPMTKEEVRHLSVCRLGLTDKSVVYDIGGGTGSVSVEIAALSQDIKVYSIEVDEDCVSLIKKNADKFRLSNIEIVKGMAPKCLEGLPEPDCVFIGGTKGNISGILHALYEKHIKKPDTQMCVVVNALTLESVGQINEALKEFDTVEDEVTYIQVNKSKKAGGYTLMTAENGIYIFSFKFGQRI